MHHSGEVQGTVLEVNAVVILRLTDLNIFLEGWLLKRLSSSLLGGSCGSKAVGREGRRNVGRAKGKKLGGLSLGGRGSLMIKSMWSCER